MIAIIITLVALFVVAWIAFLQWRKAINLLQILWQRDQQLKEALAWRDCFREERDARQNERDASRNANAELIDLTERAIEKMPAKSTRRRYNIELDALRHP